MSQLRLSHFLLCPGLLHLFVLLLPFCLSLPLFSRTCQLLGNGKSIVGAIPCGRPVTGPIRLALSFANKIIPGREMNGAPHYHSVVNISGAPSVTAMVCSN